MTETPRCERARPMVFGGHVKEGAENRRQVAVRRFQSALPALAQATTSESVMMTCAHAGPRGARAPLSWIAHVSPPYAGGEQCAQDQNRQKSKGTAHVFWLEARNHIVTDIRTEGRDGMWSYPYGGPIS